MVEAKLRRELARKVAELWDEVTKEVAGIPHLVGEIDFNDGPRIELSVAHFDDYTFERFLDGKTLFFVFPAEEDSPSALFMALWRFLQGKGRVLAPGVRVKGPLGESLRKLGYEVLWISGDPLVQVWAVRGRNRYTLVFERDGEDEFVLLEKRPLQ